MVGVISDRAVPLWEAAAELDITVEQIFDLIVSGDVRASQRPNGRPLVDPEAIRRALAASAPPGS